MARWPQRGTIRDAQGNPRGTGVSAVALLACFRAEGRMHQEPNAVYFNDQAERCRRLATQVMDRMMEARLLAAARTFDELARGAAAKCAAAAQAPQPEIAKCR